MEKKVRLRKGGKEEVVTGSETDRMRRQDTEKRRWREGRRGVDRDEERDADSMRPLCREDRAGIEMLCLLKIYSLLNYFQQKLRLRLGASLRGSRIGSALIKKIWKRSILGLLPYSLISLNIIEPVEG